MSLTTLLFDADVAYNSHFARTAGRGAPNADDALGNGEVCGPLLTLPLAETTVIRRLVDVAQRIGSADLRVVTKHPATVEHLSRYCRTDHPPLPIVWGADAESLIEGLGSADWLCLIDPRYWPADHFGSIGRLVADSESYPGATHAVAVGTDLIGAAERVVCDGRGCVRRIQRLYHRAGRHESDGGVVPFTIVPAALLDGVRFSGLRELRMEMTRRGRLSRDVPLSTDLVDLREERGYLGLSEQSVQEVLQQPVPARYSRLSVTSLVGRGSLIHESAKLGGAVIVQRGVMIEENVRIIGPAVIGAGSVIQQNAVLAQAVLPCGSFVGGGAVVRHAVVREVPKGGRIDPRPEPLGRVESEAPSRMADGQTTSGWSDPRGLGPAMDEPSEDRRWYFAGKRAFDILASAGALVLLAPLLTVIGAIIRLDSRGPVLFAHRRERHGGWSFPCYKLRTMVVDAHRQQRRLAAQNAVDGPQFKISDDPRTTRFGRWLRKTNLDELPQLWNVLVGHMSLVGPRPSPFRENQICVPWRRARLSVRPGITGLWQVCRHHRAASDFQQWIQYDLTYVRTMSFWLDLKILLATARILLFGGTASLSSLTGLEDASAGSEAGEAAIRGATSGEVGATDSANELVAADAQLPGGEFTSTRQTAP